jgi:serine/threonine-protein kinase
MALELTPTRQTKVHAVYDVRLDDATRPDIVPAPIRFGEDATRPDIAAVRLHLDEESSDRRCAEVRYVRTDYLAHEDWPDVRLAHRQWSSGATGAVVLHHPNRRTLLATGSDGRRPSLAELLESRLRHPLVIPVVDLAPLDGELVVVSEYVAGVTLASLLREGGPLRPALAIAIACDVLRALHAGHGATSVHGELLGCVHGSLTPSDVIVGGDGRSRLVDFSLAEPASVSRSERTSGRRGYLSPEQVFDRRSDVRTDVFFVGVLLWESLTGYGLLAGDNPFERLMKFVREGFDPPSRFNAEVPDWLDDALVRALDPAAERRFQNAAEFANALAATLRPASAADVAEYVGLVGGPTLERQQLSRRAASDPPPASGTRRARPTSGARAKADPSTVPTVRPPKMQRPLPQKVETAVLAVKSAGAEAEVREAPRARAIGGHEPKVRGTARDHTTERPQREAPPLPQPLPSVVVRTPRSQRPPRSLRIAAYCAASAAVALFSAVTGVELARAVDDVEITTPRVAPRARLVPTAQTTAPRPASTAEPRTGPPAPAEIGDVPVVRADELPVAKEKASQRAKPARRWRAPARR